MTLASRSALAAICLAAAAHAQEMLWLTQFGSTETDVTDALASDGAGGAFISGYTTGSLGGPFHGGYCDAWFARHDASGAQVWIIQLGTGGNDFAIALAPDGAGSTFVAGVTAGSLGGPYKGGGGDAWLARYDFSGNQTWITQFGTSDFDEAGALAPDGAGGTFIAGRTTGSLGGPNQGLDDVWLARYDAGNQIWTTQLGTSDYDYAHALAPDSVGGTFVAGETRGSLGGPNQGDFDAWLARYDAAGHLMWITQLGTKSDDYAQALAPDNTGGAFIAGYTSGNLGGPDQGSYDAWLARYDASGNQIWITQLGTVNNDYAHALAPDGAGGAFIAGSTGGSLGGPNNGGQYYDSWIARYDVAGNQTWIAQLGTSVTDEAYALAPDGAGGALVAGDTNGSLGGPNRGKHDAWLARFSGGDSPGCYADFNNDGLLDVFDFLAYVVAFNGGEPEADCTNDQTFDLFDFLCFTNAFNVGC